MNNSSSILKCDFYVPGYCVTTRPLRSKLWTDIAKSYAALSLAMSH